MEFASSVLQRSGGYLMQGACIVQGSGGMSSAGCNVDIGIMSGLVPDATAWLHSDIDSQCISMAEPSNVPP